MRAGTLAAVIACVAVYAVTLGLTTPLLSLILEARGTGRTLIGLTAAALSVSITLVSPWTPWAVARLGMRRFVFACLAADCVLLLLLPVFDHVWAWIALRFLMGIPNAGLFIASETWINEIADERSRGRIMAIYGTTLSGSLALGPALLAVTGTAGWTPFLVGAAFIALAAFPLSRAEAPPRMGGGEERGLRLGGFLRESPVIGAAVFLTALLDMGTLALLPVYAVRNDLGPALAALALTLLGAGRVVLQLPIGWLADHADRRTLLLVCITGAGAGAAALPWAIGSLPLLCLTLIAWGGVMSGIYVVALTLIGARYRGLDLATATAGVGVLWGLGSLLGPSLLGIAMDLQGPIGFVTGLVAACSAVALFAVAVHDGPRR